MTSVPEITRMLAHIEDWKGQGPVLGRAEAARCYKRPRCGEAGTPRLRHALAGGDEDAGRRYSQLVIGDESIGVKKSGTIFSLYPGYS